MEKHRKKIIITGKKIFLFSILSVCACFMCAQTTYYVSPFGDDSKNGKSETSAWKTIAKVNEMELAFQNGDIILFEKGGDYYGSLEITKSLKLGSYGSGDTPILSGAKVINDGWTKINGNIWSIQLSEDNAPTGITNFYSNSSRMPIARHPNLDSPEKGYYRFESSAGTTSITDNDLPEGVDWSGADIVVKVYEYRFSRTKVLSQLNQVLTLQSGLEIPTSLKNNSGYFFVNHLNALDQEGEWIYNQNEKKIYVYSTTDPNMKSYFYTFYDNVVSVSAPNVQIENLSIEMGHKTNIKLLNADNFVINNINVLKAGGEGVSISNTIGGEISNSYFYENNVRAIYALNGCSDLKILGNRFEHIGMDAAYGKEKGLFAIYNESDRLQIYLNRFEDIGGGAIVTGGKSQLIRRNYVNHALMLLDDMGAIYTNNNLGGLTTEGSIIEENIVLNCPGEPFSNATNHSWAHGIYLDNHSSNVTVRNNTSANIGTSCYFMHRPTNNIEFTGNLGYNGNVDDMIVQISSEEAKSYRINFKNNILISDIDNPNHSYYRYTSAFLDFDNSGTYENNFFVNTHNIDRLAIRYFNGDVDATRAFTVHDFDASRPNAANNSPIMYKIQGDQSKDIFFRYNDSETDKVIQLEPNTIYLDAKGNPYENTVTIPPFSAVALLKYGEGNIDEAATYNPPSGFMVEEVSMDMATLSWNSYESAINYDLRYRVKNDNNWIYFYNVLETSFILTELSLGKEYECQIRTSGIGKDSDWSSSVFFTSENTSFVFLNCHSGNIFPADALGTSGAKWHYRGGQANGSLDGNYVETFVEHGAPDIFLKEENLLDPTKKYEIYLLVTSPVTQLWSVKAKLPDNSDFIRCNKETYGAEALLASDGVTMNRLFRVFLGTVQGKSDLRVDFSIDNGENVLRSVFDGIHYKIIGDADDGGGGENNEDVGIDKILVNGSGTDINSRFVLDCGDDTRHFNIEIVTLDPNARVTGERVVDKKISLEILKPSVYGLEFTVVSSNGKNTKDYKFEIEKRFDFNSIVVTKWNNTFLVNNNPNTNGGYNFTVYKWYKNGVEIGNGKQYYSAGNRKGDLLDEAAVYSVQLITDDGKVLNTCEESVMLKSIYLTVYPNPVSINEIATIKSNLPQELANNALIEVYDISGMLIYKLRASNSQESRLKFNKQGMYLLRMTCKNGMTLNARVLVK